MRKEPEEGEKRRFGGAGGRGWGVVATGLAAHLNCAGACAHLAASGPPGPPGSRSPTQRCPQRPTFPGLRGLVTHRDQPCPAALKPETKTLAAGTVTDIGALR